MSKYIYAVTTNRAENGKLYAEAIRLRGDVNLADILRDCKNILTFNVMPSKAKAVELAMFWDDSFRANGTAYFDRNYADCITKWN